MNHKAFLAQFGYVETYGVGRVEQALSFGLYFITATCIFAILAMSLDLQVGTCGLINFGQVAFLCVGAYTAAIAVDRGISPFFAALLAMGAGMVLGVVLALTVRNLSGTYWGILSLAIAQLVHLVMLNERWIGGGANGISVLVTVPNLTVFVVGTTIVVYLLYRVLHASPFGRVVRLIREGDRLPQALGKNVLVFKVETMCLAGLFGGIAGAQYAFLNGFMSPDDCLPIETFILWAMVVLGGRGNPTGIIFGAVVIQGFSIGSRLLSGVIPIDPDTLSALRMVLIGLLIVAVMKLRPEGAFPERRRVFRAAKTPPAAGESEGSIASQEGSS